MHTEGHNTPPNTPPGGPRHGKGEIQSGTHAGHGPSADSAQSGFETEDIRVGGIVTFLAGFSGFITIFFFFCFALGKVINHALIQYDGPANKWHKINTMGTTPPGGKLQDLTPSPVMEQRQLAAMTNTFPTPRLLPDDGNQEVADMHAREDLLLNYYSTSSDLPKGAVRIPIQRAMELIIQRGLPQAPASAQPQALMAGESRPIVTAPLTNGFARTGFEQQTILTREEQNEYRTAIGSEEAKADQP